jgi:VWFA-related protein
MNRSWSTLPAIGLLMVALLVASGDAQQTATSPQPPVFRTGINFVRVDVIVNDRTGQPVSNLQASDFQVTEDGKPQTVETFKLVKLDGGAVSTSGEPVRAIRNDDDEQTEAARDDVRLFGVFLDDYHVRRGNSMSVRTPLSKFIDTQLGPSDMVGLMYPLQPVSSVRMTRDHDAVIRAIGQFDGRKYDYTPRNQIEEQYSQASAETVENIRNQVSLSALKGFIIHMGTLKEGRKALILVSEGFSAGLPPQLRDPIAVAPGAFNPDSGNPTAGLNDPNELRLQMAGNSDLTMRLRDVWDAANRNNVAIYAVDPRGLPTTEFDMSQPAIVGELDRQYLNASIDTLRQLAEQTDGRAIVNRNDLAVGMTQLVKDTSAYYLLGYNSTIAPADGKFHEIKVQVKRAGVQVRARRGYWALTTEEVSRALAPARPDPPKAVENALGAISQPASSHAAIRTWIGTSRGENGKTKVTFVWEAAPRAVGDRSEAPARVMLTAVGGDGAPTFRGRVPDLALASSQAPPNGVVGAAGGGVPRTGSRVSFDVAPGKLQLRMSIEGSGAQVLDTDAREIAVPDLTAARAILGTPAVLRARTARDYQQMKTDPDAVPVVGREFARSDRLLVRVPAYGPGGTTPMLSVHLLNRTGQAMSELPVTASTQPSTVLIDLPLAGLAAGEYLLEIKTTDGDDSALLGFRVTG